MNTMAIAICSIQGSVTDPTIDPVRRLRGCNRRRMDVIFAGMDLDQPADPTSIVALAPSERRGRGVSPIVSFDRRELTLILAVYSRMLTVGMARDYAIDHLKDRSVFSIFRRASETPLYRVIKTPKDAQRQGAWSVSSPAGGTLKRGRDLRQVLRVFDKKLIRAID